MTRDFLLEGPFESDYSLAIVNRCLARGFLRLGAVTRLHQRDNTRAYYPSSAFLRDNPDLAPLFLERIPDQPAGVHSRYIYPPYIDTFAGRLRAIHCYGWEESRFPRRYADDFNGGVDLITVMSAFVRDVLQANGVQVPISVVGLGADHILQADAVPVSGFEFRGFTFLHVSSCFPRKAADVLVREFCQEFTRTDDVRLVIKTFDNPHNRIREIVAEASAAWPRHAPIEILWDSCGLGEMRWLYEQAGCLVLASRGEGFGLPVAEAMLTECPVIATIYSGLSDICSEETCWPVEYKLTEARTHLTEGASYWADPVPGSLREQLRSVYEASESEKRRKTDLAREFVRSRFTWTGVAQRHQYACEKALAEKFKPSRVIPASGAAYRIGFVSSWNTRCGIAEYTRYLANSLPNSCQPLVFASRAVPVRDDEEHAIRCWDAGNGSGDGDAEGLLHAILQNRPDAVSIQFNFGFFSPNRLKHVVAELKRNGIVTAITMHATEHREFTKYKPALVDADLCICHRDRDIDRLRELGVSRNVVRQSQGIPSAALDRDSIRASRRRTPGSFVVSCFGFFLPPKGIHQLIYAADFVRRVYPLIQLNLVNALYPTPASKEYADACLALIEEKCLGAHVTIKTDFLDDQAVLSELACSDLVVLPYLRSTESSSAAIRLPVASMTPVLCSDLPIFDEFQACVHRFPAGDAIALANEILRLVGDGGELNKFQERQAKMVSELSWPVIAERFACMLIDQVLKRRRHEAARSGV